MGLRSGQVSQPAVGEVVQAALADVCPERLLIYYITEAALLHPPVPFPARHRNHRVVLTGAAPTSLENLSEALPRRGQPESSQKETAKLGQNQTVPGFPN